MTASLFEVGILRLRRTVRFGERSYFAQNDIASE